MGTGNQRQDLPTFWEEKITTRTRETQQQLVGTRLAPHRGGATTGRLLSSRLGQPEGLGLYAWLLPAIVVSVLSSPSRSVFASHAGP